MSSGLEFALTQTDAGYEMPVISATRNSPRGKLMSALTQPANAGRPSRETFYVVDSAAMAWGDGGGEGFLGKELFVAQDGRQAHLIKVEPGAHAGSHSHDRTEHLLVLEGDFYDQNQTYKKGDFIVREPGANHIAGSKNGALIFLMFT
jgi:quercetin dioxygenase-like cupin family protein